MSDEGVADARIFLRIAGFNGDGRAPVSPGVFNFRLKIAGFGNYLLEHYS
jgi:hypothetical protein